MSRPSQKRALLLTLGVLYAALLVISLVAERREHPSSPTKPIAKNGITLTVPAMGPGGPIISSDPVIIHALRWGNPNDPRPAVILIHGSPGAADNFSTLGPLLAADGRRIVAIDMPGFGQSSNNVPSYAARAHAHYVLLAASRLGLERPHILGWSMGGVVSLNYADLVPSTNPFHPSSITLLAAAAAQETEGSGSFYFEHAKYTLGVALEWSLKNLFPDFGRFTSRSMRNFFDTDQRPIRAVMESLDTPVLILHGRNDPLVSDWAAERHHELIPASRLIMTPHSHFMPFLQAEVTAGHLEPFLARHDTPGTPAETGTLDLASRPDRPLFDALVRTARSLHWITAAAVCAGLARLRRETATAFAGLLVAASALDFGVAFLGLLIGRALHPREPWLTKNARWALGLPIWTALALLIAQLATGPGTPAPDLGWLTLPLYLAAVVVLLNTIKLAPTRAGRRRITATVRRMTHHEWWPAWLLYALTLPRLIALAIRHRSLTVWTCVNPGISPGGGITGESKQAILRGFRDPRVLTQHTIGAHEPDRARRARELIHTEPALGGFPVIVKPEAGQRGSGVILVRTEAELDRAINATEGTACIQRHHPGPVEIGVFWTRDPVTVGDERTDTTQGRVFAVTRKVFPTITGDGESTLRQLVLAHRRYRLQAGAYLEQLGDRAGDVPAEGETVTLTSIGNHARGCRFEDGADLITPELSAAIDELARTWRGPAGEPFDYGRFDIRSSSDEAVRTATDLAVIELNGVTSEATNLYDPSWSVRRAIRLLAEQWNIAFELGAARRRAGVTPMGVAGVVLAAMGRSGPDRSRLEP